MKYSTATILEKIQAGETLDYLFFWGHRRPKDGSISKSCLSQWWISPFVEEDITYQTAEHYMMAGKARVFSDEEILKLIIRSENPKEVKGLGRKIKNFEDEKWNANKYNIVVRGNLLKFSQHSLLKNFLLSTGDKVIVEASPFDRIWGIGMSQNNAEVHNPAKWRGSNLLGFALMEVRDQLKNQLL